MGLSSMPSSHNVFTVHCAHRFDRIPKIGSLKRGSVYCGSQCQPCQPQGGGGGGGSSHGRGELLISWQLGNRGKERPGVLAHPSGITSSNKVPLQSFHPL